MNYLISFLFSIFVVSISLGQGYNFINYTVDDGLPSNNVYGTIQDDRGFIWIFTDKGITRYDGYDFMTYTVQDGLPTNDIWSMTEDHLGRIWLNCFSKDIYYLEGDSIKKFLVDKSIKFNTFRDHCDYNGNIWVLNDNLHYYKIDGDSIKAFVLGEVNQKFIENKNIYGGFDVKVVNPKFPYKHTWIGKDTVWEVHLLKEDIKIYPKEDTTCFFLREFRRELSRGNIRVFYKAGEWVIIWNHKTKQTLCLGPDDLGGLKNGGAIYVNYINGKFQINTENKLVEVDTNLTITDSFYFPNLSKRSRIHRAIRDKYGNYWVATHSHGLFFLAHESKNAQQLAYTNRSANVLEGDGKGQLVWATDDARFGYLIDGAHKELEVSKTFGIAKKVVIRDANRFWVGFQNGLLYFDHGKISSVEDWNVTVKGEEDWRKEYKKITRGKNIKDLFYDKKSESLWVGLSKGLLRYDLVNMEVELITSLRINNISQEGSDTIWLGVRDGLAYWTEQDGIVSLFKERDNELFSQNILDLKVDRFGRLWVGTDGYGVYCYDGTRTYSLEHTSTEIVSQLFIDVEDNLWVGTNNGLKQIKLDATQPDCSRFIRKLTLNDGIPTKDILSVYADSTDVYIGTSHGITKLSKTFIWNDESPPKLYLTKILVNGQETSEQDLMNLTYKQNELEFIYFAISYKSYGQITYERKQQGGEPSMTMERSWVLENQSSGSYSLLISAIDVEGRKSEDPIEINFQIAPPWWQSWWFSLLMALGFILFVAGIALIRVQNIKRKEELTSEINKKFAELELHALQSQMNPHFVFNALGAIQFFIHKGNIDMADEFLAQFAQLMRLFLESSKNKYVTLEQEIDLLRRYVEIENIRFEDSFSFELKVDEDLHTHSILLPSMLIQPFIENAINHGLFHMKQKGDLLVEFRLEKEDTLACIVEDNGIGRVAAQKIKEQSRHNHVSRGMQIVEERIKTLKAMEESHITINIEDLYHEEHACGTRSIIYISLEE